MQACTQTLFTFALINLSGEDTNANPTKEPGLQTKIESITAL
jgi:hypothetical protein